MSDPMDLSILSEIRDPMLRASIERLGNAMAKADAPEPEPTRELEPPSSAKIIQFPLFSETTRPVSNDLARSALFSCVQGKDRVFIKDALLPTTGDREIRFDGEQLNQDDHDLLMQMVFMAQQQHKPPGSWVMVPAYAILQALGRQVGGKQYHELRADILRLARAMVIIRDTKTRREVFGHHLVAKAEQDEKTHHWIYRLDPDLRALYGDMTHTLIDWDQRLALKGKDMARWLQLYFATHAKPFPVKVATLRDLSGSRAKALKHFRSRLKTALNDLRDNDDIERWEIDPTQDLLYVERGRSITASQKRYLERNERRT